MSLSRALALVVAMAALLVTALPAAAQLPTTPGDFVIAIDLSGEAGSIDPSCDPDLTTIGLQLLSGQSTVNATCTTSSSETGKTTSGTASNPTLAASTGDAGFNSGTIAATCDANQATRFALAVTTAGATMKSFSGSAFYACAFTLTFQDAQQSTLSGTIEVNATLGNGSATDTANTITIAIKGTVYVTGGTGVFADAVGSGTFDQTQTIDIPAASTGVSAGGSTGPTAQEQAVCTAAAAAGAPLPVCNAAAVAAVCAQKTLIGNADLTAACTAAGRRLQLRITPRAGNASTMKVKLKKGNGAVRILAPAPPAGKPKGTATVKAKTKVKLAATKGASCTVRTNTGTVVGSGSGGRGGLLLIRPKAGAYAGATSITATCTKSGKSFTSNKVKIRL